MTRRIVLDASAAVHLALRTEHALPLVAAAREAAGMDELHFHDLRHWAASLFAVKGASLRQLVDLLGHADISHVMRYAHLCEGGHLGAIADRIAATS